MAISFKSVGKTKEQQVVQSLNNSPTPIGIATPLKFGNDTLFNVHYSLADQVHDNLKNLIQTNWGDRLGLYDLGANLRPLLSEFVSKDDFDGKAIERISGAVGKWMPYISLETFDSSIDRIANSSSGGTAVVKLTIVYSVPALEIRRRALEVTLYVM